MYRDSTVVQVLPEAKSIYLSKELFHYQVERKRTSAISLVHSIIEIFLECHIVHESSNGLNFQNQSQPRVSHPCA